MYIDARTKISAIVVHKDCPDGIASALILKAAFPRAKVIALDYNQERETLPVESNMLFCDMSPPESRIQEFVAAQAIVMCHHKTEREIVRSFGIYGFFGDEEKDPGVSGAVLAQRHVGRNVKYLMGAAVERFARLAGIRDTWQKDSPEWVDACKQAQMLLFLGQDKALDLGVEEVMKMQEWLGDHLWKKQMAKAKFAADTCKLVKIDKYKIAIINNEYEQISDASNLIDADIIAAFRYEDDNKNSSLRVSLRSRGRVDLSSIVDKLGGGGHSGAGGFRLRVSHDSPNPYQAIEQALNSVL